MYPIWSIGHIFYKWPLKQWWCWGFTMSKLCFFLPSWPLPRSLSIVSPLHSCSQLIMLRSCWVPLVLIVRHYLLTPLSIRLSPVTKQFPTIRPKYLEQFNIQPIKLKYLHKSVLLVPQAWTWWQMIFVLLLCSHRFMLSVAV